MCLFGCVLLFARLTGGHFNPAVTLALSISNQVSVADFFIYLIAQFLGAFLGGVLAFAMLSMDAAPYMQE